MIFLDPSRKTPLGEFAEVILDEEWPSPDLIARPRDELAQRVLDYAALYRSHPAFPPSPWSNRRGDIHLPNLDEPQPETDEVPKYRVKSAAAFIGCNLFSSGMTASFAGWPVDPFNLEAVNESAELVLAYQSRYGTNRKLSGQPHQSGRLNFPNPALANSPIAPVMRWSGAAS
jgi:hypothetical protein